VYKVEVNPSGSWLPDWKKQDLSLKSVLIQFINTYGRLVFRRSSRNLLFCVKLDPRGRENFVKKWIKVQVLKRKLPLVPPNLVQNDPWELADRTMVSVRHILTYKVYMTRNCRNWRSASVFVFKMVQRKESTTITKRTTIINITYTFSFCLRL